MYGKLATRQFNVKGKNNFHIVSYLTRCYSSSKTTSSALILQHLPAKEFGCKRSHLLVHVTVTSQTLLISIITDSVIAS